MKHSSIKISFILCTLFVTATFALDMPADSEQFYVAQGLFAELGIEQEACTVTDPVINFACGQFDGGLDSFKLRVTQYVSGELPGLFLAREWFDSGETLVQDYRSGNGSYLIGYNPDGYVVIAFTPR